MAVIDHQSELNRAGANISGRWSTIVYFIRRYPLGAIGGLIFSIFALTALTVFITSDVLPYLGLRFNLTGFDPTSTNAKVSLAKPGVAGHIMGADFMGRDLWSRIVHGAKISLGVGIFATMLGCGLGTVIGLTFDPINFTSSGTVTGNIEIPTDTDLFRFTAPAGGTGRIVLARTGTSTLALDLVVLDSNNTPLAASDSDSVERVQAPSTCETTPANSARSASSVPNAAASEVTPCSGESA